ncbi:MAG: helix-turn-helix domain-containing protein [Bacteroidales bacterium]|nr:helix-turn-helix domain-containing protein [Bacteroidales bacterium]
MQDNKCPGFTARARMVMKKRRISQKMLAEKTGMEYQRVHRLLNNRMPLYLDDAVRVASAIGTSIDRMLEFEYEEETK